MIYSAFVSLKDIEGRKHTLSVTVTEASPERAFVAISTKVDEVLKHLDSVHGYSWRVEELFLLDQTLISLTS